MEPSGVWQSLNEEEQVTSFTCADLDGAHVLKPGVGNLEYATKDESNLLHGEKKKKKDEKSLAVCKLTPKKSAGVSDRILNKGMTLNLTNRLSLARNIREMFANFEAEVTCGEESDLRQHYSDCVKNPEHDQFKLACEFTMQDLPLKYRQQHLFSSIHLLASLTVRVAVSTVSNGRKAAYDKMGRKVNTLPFVTYGTGRVFKVSFVEGKEGRKCPCRECKNSGAVLTSWGYVDILTAKHVVFDGDEALATLCRWGYDGDDSSRPEVYFEGVGVRVSIKETDDWCKLKCVTHNIGLLKMLENYIHVFERTTHEIYKMHRGSPKKKKPKFMVIIAHPHGCPKQITTGYWRFCEKEGELDVKYTYTAATCHGSSGAPVYILGRDGRPGLYHHIHSGSGFKNNPGDTDNNYRNHSTCVFD